MFYFIAVWRVHYLRDNEMSKQGFSKGRYPSIGSSDANLPSALPVKGET